MPILSTIKKFKPGMMLMSGDNVYGAFKGSPARTVRRGYLRQAANFRALKWDLPTEAIWDDGDYGFNDGDGTFSHKESSRQMFLDFWKVPEEDRRRKGEGLYHEKILRTPAGVVQILFLDVRYFKSPWRKDLSGNPIKRYTPDDSPEKTLLGREQWEWLEAKLSQPASLRLLISPIQFLAEGHFWECWAMFPLERMKLMEMLDRHDVRNLVLLTGDRHRGAFYRDQTPGGISLIECTSSALNSPASQRDEPGPNRFTPLYVRENFGLIRLDWKTKSVQVELRDLFGKLIHSVTLPEIF